MKRIKSLFTKFTSVVLAAITFITFTPSPAHAAAPPCFTYKFVQNTDSEELAMAIYSVQTRSNGSQFIRITGTLSPFTSSMQNVRIRLYEDYNDGTGMHMSAEQWFYATWGGNYNPHPRMQADYPLCGGAVIAAKITVDVYECGSNNTIPVSTNYVEIRRQ